MPFLERQAKHPRAGDPLHLLRHVLHPRLGFWGPSDGLLGAYVEPRHLEACGEQDVARRGAEHVLRVAPQPRLVLRAVDADPPEHDEPWARLSRVVEDLLERLAVEERF